MSDQDSGREPDRNAYRGTALLLIDLVNTMDFEGAERLRENAALAVPVAMRLRDEADRLGIPVIYVNDNFGHWHADRAGIVDRCLRDDSPARELIERIAPRPDDFFVIKPHLSGFYATGLPVLLPKLGANRLILAGVATDICVLFTAADAHMRDYDLWIPADGVASESDARNGWALAIMQQSMGAETASSQKLSMQDWCDRDASGATRWIAEGS